VSRPADLALGEFDASSLRTVIVDGVRISVDLLRSLTTAAPAAHAGWKLLKISRESGSYDVVITVKLDCPHCGVAVAAKVAT
jgi:hypothetical protein